MCDNSLIVPCPLSFSAAAVANSRRLTTIARQMKENESFSKTWFSDVSCYPIIGILGIATVGWMSFISYKFAYCPNVRVTSKHKGKVIREW